MNNTQLAKKYDVSARTIARWRTDGAPLDNDKSMAHWLASRRQLNDGTRKRLTEARHRVRQKADPSNHVPGAAAALRRLELSEADAYAAFQAALKDGDPGLIRSERETWLRISTELRRYDLQIEVARRDAGELMSRKDIEAILRRTADTIHFATTGIAFKLSERKLLPTDVKRLLWSEWVFAFAAARAETREFMRLPEWITEALTSNGCYVGFNKEWTDGVTEAMVHVFGHWADREPTDTRGEEIDTQPERKKPEEPAEPKPEEAA